MTHTEDARADASSAGPEPAIAVKDVTFTWPGSGSDAGPGKSGFGITIDSFSLLRGSRTLLLGPSGSGKSTLLSLLCGIAGPKTGTIHIMGTDLTKLGSSARDRFRAEHFGIIFQMFNLLPYGSVIDNVLLPLSFASGRRAKARVAGSEQAEAERLLLALGLTAADCAKQASALSVGQQQRVAVARALIGAPQIIVADEPTSALDKVRQEQFLDLLFAQVADAQATLIMVSHDETLADRFDQVLHLPDLLRRATARDATHVGATPGGAT